MDGKHTALQDRIGGNPSVIRNVKFLNLCLLRTVFQGIGILPLGLHGSLGSIGPLLICFLGSCSLQVFIIQQTLLSAKQPEVAGAVARAKEDARLQKERANALQAELLNVQMDALPSPEKVRHVLLFVGELDAIALRNAVNTLTGKYSGYCGIFAGDDTNGYRFIVGSASCNCQELADRMRRELSAKGGGSAPMIQGNVAVTADTLQTMWVSL